MGLTAQIKIFCSFGVMQLLQTIVPLLALPWLARKLGNDAFGLLMYMCLIPPLIALLMDWGISLGGARATARERENFSHCRMILGAALSAKIIMGGVCLVLGCAVWKFIPHAWEYPMPFWLAICMGMIRSFNPYWFLQGIGQGIPLLAFLDLLSSLGALLLMMLFIASAQDWPLYLLILIVCKGLAYAYIWLTLCLAYKPVLQRQAGWRLLKDTSIFSWSSLAQMFSHNGSQLVLGFFLTAEMIGNIVAVSKMIRALAGLINPFTQTLYPHFCRLPQASTVISAMRLSLFLSVLGSVLVTALAWLLAPWLIEIALGSRYASAAVVLRLMLLAVPFMVANNVLTQQILIPYGKEKTQMRIQINIALFSVPCAMLLGSQWGEKGGALLPLILEAALLAGFLLEVKRLSLLRDNS